MAPHSNTLAWKIPWMEEPGGLQSMGSRRVGHDWATSLSLFTFMHWRRKWYPTSLFLPGESQGQEPGGLPSMGSHRVGHDWRDLAAAAAAVLFCNWVARMCVRSVAQSCWTLWPRRLSSKESACNAGGLGLEIRVPSLGLDRKEMATHSSILAQKIPWTEEPGGLQSLGSQRIWHWATKQQPPWVNWFIFFSLQ